MRLDNLIDLIKTYLLQLYTGQLSSNKIAAIQEKKFRALLKHAVSSSRYYQQLYQGIDIEKCSITDLPIVTRSDISKHYDQVVCSSHLKQDELQVWLEQFSDKEILFKHNFIPMKTSGTTSERLLVTYDAKAMNAIHINMLTRLSISWHKNILVMLKGLIGKPLKIATLIMTTSNFPAISASRYSTHTHRLFVRHRVISYDQPLHNTISELNQFQPDILYSYAGVLETLAREQLNGNLQLKFNNSLSAVLSMSEVLTPKARKLVKQAWGIIIDDTYGAAECLAIGRSCEQENMHLMSDICLLEAVDENNQPVARGKPGKKILITNLVNYAQPFIRYEIKDICGFALTNCSCGSPFPTLLPVQGRSGDNMLIKNSKAEIKEVTSIKFILELDRVDCISDFQLYQTDYNMLVCYYVPLDKNSQKCEKAISRALNKAITAIGFTNDLSFEIKKMDKIPRNPVSGKRQMIVTMENL